MTAFPEYYALSFNPLDKQCLKEKYSFKSSDFKQMVDRLDYLKKVYGNRYIHIQTRHGKDLQPAMLF